MSINFRKKSTNNFITTLLDLFLYDNEELAKSIFEMLHKTFHQYIILMDSLKDTQIITDPDIVE